MIHVYPHARRNLVRTAGWIASLGMGLAVDSGVMAQGYDRIIRPSDITLEPAGVEGLFLIHCTPIAVNGTADDLDLSMEVTRLVNGEPVDTQLVPLTAAGGGGYTCRGNCPGDCSGLPHESECIDVPEGCSCTIPVDSDPVWAQLSPGDTVGVSLSAANGSVAEFHLENDSAEIMFGVPAATVISAFSRRTNPDTRAFCDTDLHTVPPRKAEPHQGGIQEIHIGFDVIPAGNGAGWTLEEATCAAPAFVAYGGASAALGRVIGNELVITFTPGLENARSYRLTLGPTITTIQGQSVEARGLVGDMNHDGQVNATDRSIVVGAWTGGEFTCSTDLNNDGQTNASDRSVVVGAWTGQQNCAP